MNIDCINIFAVIQFLLWLCILPSKNCHFVLCPLFLVHRQLLLMYLVVYLYVLTYNFHNFTGCIIWACLVTLYRNLSCNFQSTLPLELIATTENFCFFSATKCWVAFWTSTISKGTCLVRNAFLVVQQTSQARLSVYGIYLLHILYQQFLEISKITCGITGCIYACLHRWFKIWTWCHLHVPVLFCVVTSFLRMHLFSEARILLYC